MQCQEGILDVRIDPCGIAVRGCLRAFLDDLRKGCVARHPEPALADHLGQRLRQMKAVQRQYRPPFRFHPIGIGIIARVGHREDPMGISAQQQVNVYWQADSV
jgi:hypothetical protein